MDDVIKLILGGGIGVAVVEAIKEFVLWILNRIAAKKNGAKRSVEDRLTAAEKNIVGLTDGERVILYDKIKYLGKKYIVANEISFEDREDLIAMHGVYHNSLGGNGNLDLLMAQVNALPMTGGASK